MLWDLEWAEQEPKLRAAAESDPTFRPRPLLEKPLIGAHLIFVWDAFWALHGDRALGMGGIGAIPFTAIDAYGHRYGVVSTDSFDRFQRMIKALDNEFLKWNAQEKPKNEAG